MSGQINTRRFSEQQFQYKTGHRGLFFLRIHHPERKLTLVQGGQSVKQYTTRVVRNQSTDTRLPAA